MVLGAAFAWRARHSMPGVCHGWDVGTLLGKQSDGVWCSFCPEGKA